MSKDVIFSFSYFGLNRTKKEKSAILNDWRLFQPGSRCLWVFVWLNTSSSLSDKLHTEMVFFFYLVLNSNVSPPGSVISLPHYVLFGCYCVWQLIRLRCDSPEYVFVIFGVTLGKHIEPETKAVKLFFFMKLIWILTSCCGGRVYNLYLKWNSLQNAT